MLDHNQSWMEFQYGVTKPGISRQTVPIKKIFLERSWKFEKGKYCPYKQLATNGKDIAIILLQRQIKEKTYPRLLPLHDCEQQIQIYGYPAPCLDDHKNATILRKATGEASSVGLTFENGWTSFSHNAPSFPGMYRLFIFFFFLLNVHVSKNVSKQLFVFCFIGMSGGPCYLVNKNQNANETNQIIGVHSASGLNDTENYGTLFTHKAQELINFAHKFLPKKRRKSQKKSEQPPKKKAKKNQSK